MDNDNSVLVKDDSFNKKTVLSYLLVEAKMWLHKVVVVFRSIKWIAHESKSLLKKLSDN